MRTSNQPSLPYPEGKGPVSSTNLGWVGTAYVHCGQLAVLGGLEGLWFLSVVSEVGSWAKRKQADSTQKGGMLQSTLRKGSGLKLLITVLNSFKNQHQLPKCKVLVLLKCKSIN